MVTNLSIPIATILGGDFNSTFAMPLTLQAILPVNRYNVVHGVAYSHDHYQVIALLKSTFLSYDSLNLHSKIFKIISID